MQIFPLKNIKKTVLPLGKLKPATFAGTITYSKPNT